MSRVRELLEELESLVEGAEKKLEIAGIQPKYALGQSVWILKGDIPSWYNFPIYGEDAKIEDMFEKEEIKTIVISKLHDSNTRGCGVPNEDPVVVAYTFNRYYQHEKQLLEKEVYETLQDAIKANKDAFKKDIDRYKKEQAQKREDEKKRLKARLAEL